MENATWLKISAIVALFLGAIYVLLPTILQEDADQAIAANASQTSVPGAKKSSNKLRFTVSIGDPNALVNAVKDRLQLLQVPTERVFVDDDGRLVVVRAAGVSIGEVIEALEREPPSITLVDVAAFIKRPDDAPTSAKALLAQPEVQALRGQAMADAPAVPVQIRQVDEADGTLTLSTPPKAPALLLVVDGRAQGVVVMRPSPEGLGSSALADAATFAAGFDLFKAVHLTELPGELEPEVPEALAPQPTDAATKSPSRVPPWLAGMLPNTRMPLGLDLQGGIDLTLEVELDAALLSQASRDVTYLKDRAKERNLVLDQVKRARAEPMILVSSQADSRDIIRFFASQFRGDYDYYDDQTDPTDSTVVWHRFAMSAERQQTIKDQSVQQVLEVLRRRVADTGVRDPVVVRKGGGKISVQLPGLDDTSAAQNAIGRTALLEFRLVDHDFDTLRAQQLFNQALEAMPPDQQNDDLMINAWLKDRGKLPANRWLLSQWEDVRNEQTGDIERRRQGLPLVLEPVVLTGSDINEAVAMPDSQTQQWMVHLEFKPSGANTFCRITGERTGKQFAIVLDNEVQSAPRINERICGGRAQITMNNDINAAEEAKSLAVVLRTGALNAPVSVGGVRQIGPSLGADAIRSGSLATVLGGLVVLVFMGLWYRTSGLIADIALVLNVLLVLSGMSVLGWTLTLSGIAGIALTIGMAVDANIIIYERIREELAKGSHARKAVDVGFEKGAVAVLDANVTTAIAGVVLYSYGDVTIQGFAVTLLIGIGTTLVTALFVTRTLLELATRSSSTRLRI